VRSGDKERVKELEGSQLGVRDTIVDLKAKKASQFVPKRGEKSINTALIGPEQRIVVPVQIWEWTLFELPECKEQLGELLDEAELKALKATSESGEALIYLDIRDTKDRRYEVWVDPGTNYLVRKLICHGSRVNTGYRIEQEVLSFREVKPGLFFPERVVYSLIISGDWMTKTEATLANLRVNETLPAGMFQHTFPPGTLVTDYEHGTGYTLGANGEPTKVGSFVPSSPPVSVGTSTPPTADDVRWPWHWFVVGGSALMVVLGLGLMIWKRRREAAA